MMVDYEFLKAKAFNDKFVVGFYGGGEGFAKRIQPRDGCYVEQGRHKHPAWELKGISQNFLEEDQCN